MKADKWYPEHSSRIPAPHSHTTSQVTAKHGKNIMKTIIYKGFSSRSNAISSKFSSDESEAVSIHMMDEQQENPSDHNFCLDSFVCE